MINLKTITQAIEAILKAGLSGYTITRNAERNTSLDVAARGNGWIGIYRARVNYSTLTTGRWLTNIEIDVELQVAHVGGRNGNEIAEDKLQDGEKAILDILTANKKLDSGSGPTVDMTNGFQIEYEYNAEEAQGIYHHASIITLLLEVQSQT